MIQIPIRGGVLRPWLPSDKPALLTHANNLEIARWMTNRFPHPYTEADADFWTHFPNPAEPLPYNFAIVVEGEAVGGIGLEPMSDVRIKNGSIGYWLGQAHWGKGLVSAALPKIIEYAFANFDWVRLQAMVYQGNTRSMRVLEKAGFRLDGVLPKAIYKLEQVLDGYMYGLLRPDDTHR